MIPKRLLLPLWSSLAIAGCLAIASCDETPPQEDVTEPLPAEIAPIPEEPLAPLLDGIGDHHFTITTDSEQAQRFFNQGLILSYGFNHAEAVRAFREAARLDPTCGICYWGVALALGPNINAPMPAEAVPEAWEALQQANALAEHESVREQAYIKALQARYTNDPSAPRGSLDTAYADAMGELARQFPSDADAQTLYAEAMMDVSPWNYYDRDGNPSEMTPRIIETLESVMRADPDHPGAIHLYIHTVEASKTPGRAEAAADRLVSLVPMAGHLVHMPSHIYVRVGRYHDAVEINARAAIADEAYIAQCNAQGFYPAAYYPHNIHFLWFAAMMEGQGDLALDQARKLVRKIPLDMAAQVPLIEHMLSAPIYTLVRFGRWEDALDEPEPDQRLPLARAMWHYARGMANASLNRTDDATLELRDLFKIASGKAVRERYTDFRGPETARLLLDVAREQLMSQIAESRGDHEGRVEHLERAVAAEDELGYSEPPLWFFPLRQALGIALLRAGDAERAEKVLREDLEKFPRNGWSLYGLSLALSAQKSPEARRVRDEFTTAWSYADILPEDIPF